MDFRETDVKMRCLLPNSSKLAEDEQISAFVESVIAKPFVVVDLETTGLSANDEMTEIGAVKIEHGALVDELQTFVNPGVSIPPMITAMTGITNSMVEDTPSPSEALEQFLDFAGDAILIAHNAHFDLGFLQRAASRAGITWPRPIAIDTLALSRRLLPRPLIGNHKLATLAKFFGIANPGAHRALADAYTTAEVFAGLVNRLDEAGANSFAELIAANEAVPARQRDKARLARDLPNAPGVYRFLDANGLTLYIGSATNLRSRVRSYFTPAEKRQRIRAMLDRAASVKVDVCATPLQARVCELQAIRAEAPIFNSASRRQLETCWLVMRDGFLTTTHTITPDEAAAALGPFRHVKHALAAREAIRIALGAGFSPVSELSYQSVPAIDAALATKFLEGRGHAVSNAVLTLTSDLAEQAQFEAAARVRDYLFYYLNGLERSRDTASVGRARKIIWAHHVPSGGWQIHAASRGRLLASLTTPAHTSPAPQVQELLALEALPNTGVHLAYATWEEVRLLTRDLMEPDARLIAWDSPDPWGWPADSDLSELERFANMPRPKRGRS